MNDFWNEVWKSFFLIVFGMLILRISGRKSISQMTIPTTITMISIGTIIVQPIANEHISLTVVAAVIFILVLILVEALQVRWSWLERWIKGPSIIVVKDGQFLLPNMKKLRLTVDALEMKLRQQGISRLSDVKSATIESNGQLGYELHDSAKPVTLAQLESVLSMYMSGEAQKGAAVSSTSHNQEKNLFSEINSENN